MTESSGIVESIAVMPVMWTDLFQSSPYPFAVLSLWAFPPAELDLFPLLPAQYIHDILASSSLSLSFFSEGDRVVLKAYHVWLCVWACRWLKRVWKPKHAFPYMHVCRERWRVESHLSFIDDVIRSLFFLCFSAYVCVCEKAERNTFWSALLAHLLKVNPKDGSIAIFVSSAKWSTLSPSCLCIQIYIWFYEYIANTRMDGDSFFLFLSRAYHLSRRKKNWVFVQTTHIFNYWWQVCSNFK